MFRSLRFRLPAIFLLGILLAGLAATGVALRLFQDYVDDRAVAELRREAAAITELYAEQVVRTAGDENERPPPPFAVNKLEKATGDEIFYVGADVFPGDTTGLEILPTTTIDWQRGRRMTFEFTPPGEKRTFLAAAHPVRIGTQTFGALIVAQPKDELRSTLVTLMERLALAFLGGIAIAGALAVYLSRRITRPVLALSRAADEVAEGRYDVEIPAGAGDDEVADLARRFREMAARLAETEERERNFLMSVSHELRTPLTAIRGHVAALREGIAEDPDAREASLAVIEHESDRLARLVGDVLDLAKLDANRFTVRREEVDMERLCERAYAAFGDRARAHGIDYRRQATARPVVITDGDRVLQIISNLLANAFRWTPDGGRVDLALSAENGTVAVDVADSGPGIRDEERERIFRPFWSGDTTGTGLGLPIARELALALGGRIELESEPGKGSRFRLVLPATPSPAAGS